MRRSACLGRWVFYSEPEFNDQERENGDQEQERDPTQEDIDQTYAPQEQPNTEPTRDAVPWIGFITGSRRSFGVADHQRESSRRLLRSAAPPLNLLREVRHDSQYAQFLREGF